MQIPKKCKIEKVVSSDQTQPAFLNPYIYDRPEGRYLYATNKQNAFSMPLEVSEDDVPGPVPLTAFKEGRKNGELLCSEEYAVIPNGVAYPREVGRFSQLPDLMPFLQHDIEGSIEIAVDVKALYDMAQAMGTDMIVMEVAEDSKVAKVKPHPEHDHISGAKGVVVQPALKRLL